MFLVLFAILFYFGILNFLFIYLRKGGKKSGG
jgi:hypothetical protein